MVAVPCCCRMMINCCQQVRQGADQSGAAEACCTSAWWASCAADQSCPLCRTDGSTDTTTDDSVTNSGSFKSALSDSVRQTTELNVDTYKVQLCGVQACVMQ